MPPPTTHFTLLLTGLRGIIAAHAAANRAHAGLLVLVWNYLGRTADRLARLLARHQAGTLRPRPARPTASAATPSPGRRPRLALPRRHAWLVRLAGHPAANHASQLEHFLTRPDLADLLAAAPQAGRLLRPLCRMLGVDPPAPLRLPVRPRPARKPPPPGPRPAAPPAGRPLPAYVRAAVRAWRPRRA